MFYNSKVNLQSKILTQNIKTKYSLENVYLRWPKRYFVDIFEKFNTQKSLISSGSL